MNKNVVFSPPGKNTINILIYLLHRCTHPPTYGVYHTYLCSILPLLLVSMSGTFLRLAKYSIEDMLIFGCTLLYHVDIL